MKKESFTSAHASKPIMSTHIFMHLRTLSDSIPIQPFLSPLVGTPITRLSQRLQWASDRSTYGISAITVGILRPFRKLMKRDAKVGTGTRGEVSCVHMIEKTALVVGK